MEKKELAERIAAQTKVPAGAAADELDQAIHDVVNNLRKRESGRPNALQRLMEEAKCPPLEKRRKAKS